MKSFKEFLIEQEKTISSAINLAREAEEYPRNLEGWPATPEEEQAEQTLRRYAELHKISYTGNAASVWREIRDREMMKNMGNTTRKIASSLVRKLMEFIKTGDLKKAYFCMNLLEKSKFRLGVDSPYLQEIIDNAKLIGIREFDREPLSIEKIQDILDRTMAYVYTVDFNSDIYKPLRAKAKIISHLGPTKERLRKNVYEIELIHYPKKKMKAYDINEKVKYNEGDIVWVIKERLKVGYEKPFYGLVIREELD
ncbi:MAG: hypothetical protein N3A54_02245 [Patescibacteria group bacterium]|nr:hypothetical protein [Patescibacteria group bacterium]